MKEAAYKALYPTIRPAWKELTYESLSEAGQKPRLEYHPASIPSVRPNVRMHVSVSHDGGYIFSSVLAEDEMTRSVSISSIVNEILMNAAEHFLTSLPVHQRPGANPINKNR